MHAFDAHAPEKIANRLTSLLVCSLPATARRMIFSTCSSV